MLQRIVLRQSRPLQERRNACVFCQHAALHMSTRAQNRRRRIAPAEIPTAAVDRYGSESAERLMGTQLNTEKAKERRNTPEDIGHSHISTKQVDANAAATPSSHGNSAEGLLGTAYAEGVLKIKPELVSKLLEQLSKFGTQLSPINLRNACASFGISIDAAYTLARLLVRSNGPLDQYQGRQILLQASALGSAKATLYIARTAVNSQQLQTQEVQPALKHLQQLAAQEPPIVPARVAQAKVHEAIGNYDRAEELYNAVINHALVPNQHSSMSRLAMRFREQFVSLEPDETVQRRIVVDNNDTELDVVAAHMGLAHMKYHITNDQAEAIRNWEVAALEYDDPTAYYNLAVHLETVAKQANQDKPVLDDGAGHDWLLLAPYKWFEYIMKAAASGHAEACYKIGLFYMLKRQGYANKIVDSRLRDTLMRSPLMEARPGIIYNWIRGISKSSNDAYSKDDNQVEVIRRWFQCSAHAGYDNAKATLELASSLHANQVS